MGAEGWVDVLARWLHIVSIVAWTGGTMFVAGALLPALGEKGGESAALARAALLRYRPIVATSTIVVIVSGFGLLGVRLSYVGVENLGLAYKIVFAIKILAALALIGIAHAGYGRLAAADEEDLAAMAAIGPAAAVIGALAVILLGIALQRF